jgi:hypothetical protein
MHRASATSGNAAAELGARHIQHIAQHPEQRHLRIDIDLDSLRIDIQLHVWPLEIKSA